MMRYLKMLEIDRPQKQNTLIMPYKSWNYSNSGHFLFNYVPENRKVAQNILKKKKKTKNMKYNYLRLLLP